MHRNHTLFQLDIYEQFWAHLREIYPEARLIHDEIDILAKLRMFLQDNPQCFNRDFAPGHMTGSILILTPDWHKCLLMNHKKLHKWLQLGGHADGCAILEEVAMKEGAEESGLRDISLVGLLDLFWPQRDKPKTSPHIPFDLDIHLIPARAREGAHYHFDLRFLAVCQKPEDIILAAEEAHELKWFTLEDAQHQSQETSMLRQWQKWEFFRTLIVR